MPSNAYYECHLTFSGDLEKGKSTVESCGWKHSYIAGDPVLGSGSRQYATKHFNARKPLDEIWDEMQSVRRQIEAQDGLRVTRAKVESVIMDQIYG